MEERTAVDISRLRVDWDDNGFFYVEGLAVGGSFSGSEGDLIGEELRALVLAARFHEKMVDTLSTIANFAVGEGDVCEIIARRCRKMLADIDEAAGK